MVRLVCHNVLLRSWFGKLTMTITVLFTMIFAGIACESGGGSNGDDPCSAPKGDRPDWCEANDNKDTNEPQISCGDGDCTENCNTCPQDCGCPSGFFCNEADWCEAIETCGNGVCDKEENCLNCYECGCLKGEMCDDDSICVIDTSDPLLDYYWLEGQWQREEDGYLVDVEVTGWDNEKGAKVEGFSPCNGWAIKDTNPNHLLFSGQSQTGYIQCSGQIDKANKKNTFTSIAFSETPHVNTYIQL